MVVFMFSHVRGPSKFSSLERNWRSWQTWPAGIRDRLDISRVECFCIHTVILQISLNWIISPNRQGVKQLFERTTYWFLENLDETLCISLPSDHLFVFVLHCQMQRCETYPKSQYTVCAKREEMIHDKVMFPNIQKWGPIAHSEKAPCHASRVWQWTKYIDRVFANEAHCNL